MRNLAEFASALQVARKVQKLTAKELGERTGLTAQAVRQILDGQSAPRLTNAMALASELGLELVLLPKEVAQALASAQQESQGPRSVVSDVERWIGSAGYHR